MKLRFAILLILSLGIFNSRQINGQTITNTLEEEKVLGSNNIENINSNYLTDFQTNPYIIGPGDSIGIRVSLEYPELTRVVTINGEGTVNLPFIKKVFVKGLTLDELNKLLNEKFSKYVKFPDLESEIVSYRPVSILIDGEVPNPGIYKLMGSLTASNSLFESSSIYSELREKEISILEKIPPNIEKTSDISFYFPTVFDALKASGGVTRFSDLANIKLIRKNTISNGGGRIQTTINFEDLILNGDSSQNIRVYDGDMIVINKLEEDDPNISINAIKTNLNPKYIRVFVGGRVNTPGNKIIGKESSLNDAIDMAGGLKVIKGPIKYLTYNKNGIAEKSIFNYKKNSKRGSKTNPYLKEGDLIMVGSGFLSQSTEVINEVTAPFTGLYSTYRLIEAFTD